MRKKGAPPQERHGRTGPLQPRRTPAAPRKATTSAAGQYLGFSLQTTRAVVHLLNGSPGTAVSVEVFEDVGVQTPDGQRIAEQAKSALAHNPVADRAVDFWKTLANWTRGALGGDLAVESTRFVLYVSSSYPPGRLVRALASARDMGAAHAALADAKKALWGTPKSKVRAGVPSSLAPHLDLVFSAPEGAVAAIVTRFELARGGRDPFAEIELGIRRKFVSEPHVPTVARQAMGWVKARIDELIRDGKQAVVSVDEFQSEMTAFVIKVDRSLILNSFAPTPPAAAIEAELPQRCYIKQLDLIGSDDAQKLRAANDYLRAAYDRTEWAARGIVHRSSIEEFQEQLVRIWESKQQLSALEMEGRPDEHVGRHLFASCSTVSAELQGLKPPAHFASGCYHSLSDEAVVGWHPRFRDLLPKASSKRRS